MEAASQSERLPPLDEPREEPGSSGEGHLAEEVTEGPGGGIRAGGRGNGSRKPRDSERTVHASVEPSDRGHRSCASQLTRLGK
ncbi:hypothetical protein CSUI_006817 [Cystoisospora suis]|uniref:Uncharacterized protein n=1 Tax=Cystoisospora suis TaxID=483139 RepID=A0A2C6KT27_9APIC|nr:hypothetical protein CSUI_006817 [Cystoisospora suis]